MDLLHSRHRIEIVGVAGAAKNKDELTKDRRKGRRRKRRRKRRRRRQDLEELLGIVLDQMNIHEPHM